MLQFLEDDVLREATSEAARHLQALVRFDTSNPPGNERPAAEYLARILADHGVETEILGPTPERSSLIARVRGNGTRRPLLFVSHLDVVPAPREGWAVDPFAGVLKDGFIWGRGAMDCKYRAVTHAMLLILARRHRLPLTRDLIIAACADEELGGAMGMEWLAAHHPDRIDAECVLGEGGGGEIPAPRGTFCAVGTGEKGSCDVTITVRGPGGHTLRTRPGNALHKLGHVLGRLEDPHLSSGLDASVGAMITAIAVRQERPVQEVLKGLLTDATRDGALGELDRLAPDFKRWLEPSLYDLVATTMVSGGVSPHAYPTEVRLTCNLRLLPGRTLDAALGRLRERIAGIEDVEITHVNPESGASQSPAGTDLYRAIEEVYREMRPDATVVPWLLGGATDVRFLRGGDRVVYGFFPSITDLPSHEWMSMTHGVNERVSLANLAWAIRVLSAVVTRLCT